MLNKSKSKANTLSELHFVSSLQLEQSVLLLDDMANEKHQVTITEVSPDEFKFKINYLPDRSKTAEITGTLQRWNGTETKIDADGEVYRVTADTSGRESAAAIALGIVALTLAGSGVVASMGLGIFVAPVILTGLGLGYYAYNGSEDKDETRVYFRARDYLLQGLINAFKSAGDVEAI